MAESVSTASLDNLLHIKRMPPFARGTFRLCWRDNETGGIMHGRWVCIVLDFMREKSQELKSLNPSCDCWIEWMDRDGHIWSVEVIDD